MKPITYRQALMKIASAMVREYGDDLIMTDTDLKMARAVIRKMRPNIVFASPETVDKEEFIKWRKGLANKALSLDDWFYGDYNPDSGWNLVKRWK